MVAPVFWAERGVIAVLLWPLSVVFRGAAAIRRLAYKCGVLRVSQMPVPVIIVGNISVGGSGKTPLVIALVRQLTEMGYRPGIVSRGFGARASNRVHRVTSDCNPRDVGDEPVLLAAHAPVAVARRRAAAAAALVGECDVIVADDGLQHYALGRDVEICLVDQRTGLGNGWCLPAGPLREPPSRLTTVDFQVTKVDSQMPSPGGHTLRMEAGKVVNLFDSDQAASLDNWRGQTVHAVAGIAHPQSFFRLLCSHGIEVIEHPFADHHWFVDTDFTFNDTLAVLMTEKDAVKCRNRIHNASRCWSVSIVSTLDPAFADRVMQRIDELTNPT